jgi:RNA polymerase sigma factor (sigma-70 family)
MENLKLPERELIYLRYTEWKSLKEIANILWIEEWNVRVKLHRTMAKLKKYLQN